MKKLYLVRHAKSAWDEPSLSDFERPLNRRGEGDAPLVATALARRGVKPDLMLSSPAVRTTQTAEILAAGIGYRKPIQFVSSLYESSDYNLMMIIRTLDPAHDSVMIIAHNPVLTMVINRISSFWIDNLPTCGVVGLSLESWDELSAYQAPCELYLTPKMLKEADGTR